MRRLRRALARYAAPLVHGEVGPVTLLPPELRDGGWDRWLIGGTILLVALGLAMVWSATSVTASRPATYVESQAIKILVGICAFAIGHRIDYHRWGRWAPGAYLLGLGLLLLVYVPGLGHSAGNARRWLNLGGVTLQPAEFARLALVAYLAFLLSKPKARLERFTTGILPCLVALAIMAALVGLQPNLSSALALAVIAVLMMLAGRIPLRHLGVLAVAGAAALPLVVRGYQIRRCLDWFSYMSERQGLQEGNYQMHQSILAIGSGQLWGRGLGESHQKWFFLPDAHTDFIYSIVGEELGLLGAVVLIGLLSVLLWRAFDSARRAPDRFGSLLAVGIGAGIAVYAGVNLLVATGLFPTTGLPLPLVSYGGSNVLVTLFSLGVLGNISSQGDSTLVAGIGEQE